MSVHYEIYSGDQRVTNDLNRNLDDEEEAKGLAKEISAGQPDSSVTVRSVKNEAPGQWSRTVATFVDGKPYPWVWVVTFLGYLDETDQGRLEAAGLVRVRSRSEFSSGALHSGSARHVIAVGASDGDTAVEMVRQALGSTAKNLSKWTHEPADHDAITAWEDKQAGKSSGP